MLLDDLIISIYCLIDDELLTLLPQLPGGRVRQCGPSCRLSDSEVLCIEVAGLFLGHAQDKDNFAYFRAHHSKLFPALKRIHRTSYVRQCANLWRIKELLWQRLVAALPHQKTLSFVDSLPLPVCRFARAPWSRNFKSADVSGLQASYGFDHVARQTFFGFRLHVRVAYPGVITGFCLTGAEVSDVAAVPQLLEGAQGLVLGDRNYASPALQQQMKREGVEATLLTAAKTRKNETDRRGARLIARVRYRIETVFGQLCQRLEIRGVQVKDTWHLASRLLRAALCHTISLHLTLTHDIKPLQFAKLLD